ncbi:hypothetical protein ACFLU5_10670 [Bacteroidota bacterium]
MTNRRDFLNKSLPGAAAVAMGGLELTTASCTTSKKDRSLSKLAEVGWCWDGQAINGQWHLSIFGVGEGTRWFGLKKCCFMFHPNTALAMEKLSDMDEVVCEISKWEYQKVVDHPEYWGLGAPMRMYHDGRISRKCREAEIVSKLSTQYPKVSGAFDDDLYGMIMKENIKAEEYRTVHEAVKSANPTLKHWGVVYSHELKKENWESFTDLLDVVTLWVWNSKDLVNLQQYVEQCQEIFPGKEIIIGCYLRDFTILDAVPMDLLKHQWEVVSRLVADGNIQGFSILGGFLIDMHPTEAMWVRDFIAGN